MIRGMQLWIVLLGVGLWAAEVSADQWPLPETETYLSRDQTWRFTVTPRPLASQLAYFQDKAANRKHAGARRESSQKTAQGSMEHLDQGQWRVVWNRPLLNDVSPVHAIVSSAGQTVTFDNWHGTGYGKDVVVIYDALGQPVRAMGLGDFLPEDYIEALPHSVSSISWGRQHYFSADEQQLVLRVVVPSESADDPRFIELPFSLATGKAILPDDNAWSAALADVARVTAANREADAKFAAAFVAPLQAPDSNEVSDWHAYLVEAFFRLDANWKGHYPATEVIPLPQEQSREATMASLKNTLTDGLNKDGTIMIGSPSQDSLVLVLSEVAAMVPRGSLKKARIYAAVDDAHNAAVAKALVPSGARYIQLNPDKSIPQRKARLDAYRASR